MTRETTAHCKTVRRLIGKRSVVLVGLMGAGKSAIGRKLAAMLELPFVDADSEIEAASQMTVADLFEQYGEPEFRALEKRVIARVLKGGPRVLATGGGAFMNEQTRQTIARRGVSIWLSADIDLLMERVSRRQNRPLLQNPDPRMVMQKLIAERYPVYAHADVEVPSQDVSKDEMAARVVEAVATFLTVGNASRVSHVGAAGEARGV
ncbi:shikimate kinase [Oricola cellulosilytica]|uniref:Shikimate kinase n=1 Tax=Oricola cellulosilytica TaxID=1429082 RepID=A0A4R0PC54_9HYPH|nr:shikimate kinase [Oricola cellulosilytica]TCD13748.1 shikimate kinase [Oricola cellulosilytica]